MTEWHYPRPELATKILKTFEVGITSYVALIAPRRKGKTLFLLNDLASEAQDSGYIPIYASFWQNMDAPHEGLISSLKEAVESISGKSSLKRLLQSKAQKATISNELLGKVDVEFAGSPQKAATNELFLIDKLIGELTQLSKKRTVLLLFDEVQHLATNKSFSPLAHALRTSLDKRQGEVKAAFTGSSRRYINLLFNEESSPFYHFVDQIPFPDLDKGFIEFVRVKLHEEYSVSLPLQSLQRAFDDFERSPYWMMKMISYLVTYKHNLKDAMSFTLTLMEESEGFADIAKKMKSVDVIVYITLCEGEGPFSEEVLARVAKETKLKGIPGNIQRSLERLKDSNVISQTASGKYHVEKPGLRNFIEHNSDRLSGI